MVSNFNRLVVPGEVIADESNGFMAGWGTYSLNGKIISAAAGTVQTIDKLINVSIKNMPYRPEQGDVVIGKVVSIENKMWKVNIFANRDAVLNLVNINLPEGEQRRRLEEDTYMMKKFFEENDLLSGEILSVHSDGGATLQTRNLKYGKLKDGVMVKVRSNLIQKMRLHFVDFVNDIKCILGKNGVIWVYYSTVKIGSEYFSDDQNKIGELFKNEEVSKDTAFLLVLFRNIIISLDRNQIQISRVSILHYLHLYSLELGLLDSTEASKISYVNLKSNKTSVNQIALKFDTTKLASSLVISKADEESVIEALKTQHQAFKKNDDFDENKSILKNALDNYEEEQ